MRMIEKFSSVLLLVCVLSAHAQSTALKTFHDAKYGVTFRYPAQWKSGQAVQFYLDSEVLGLNPDGGENDPIGKVGFVVGQSGPYAGTNLNGVQFVFNVIPRSTEEECRKRVEAVANKPLLQTTVHGITYSHYSGGDAGLGHGASREIYSSFRDEHCYLFEESIHTVSMDDPKSLNPAQWKHLRKELDGVMQSVRFESAH
jgi:hypothetical protein